MLVVINHVLTTAPTFNTTDMVGFPINAILDFPMITPAGLSAFTMRSPIAAEFPGSLLQICARPWGAALTLAMGPTRRGRWFERCLRVATRRRVPRYALRQYLRLTVPWNRGRQRQ